MLSDWEVQSVPMFLSDCRDVALTSRAGSEGELAPVCLLKMVLKRICVY